MMEKLGPTAQTLIRNGMLVEHDLGRYHMGELIKALDQYEKDASTQVKLDIIANASGYANLLQRHIAKEDEACYSFALRRLSEEDRQQVNNETREFEDVAFENGVKEKYTSWITKQIKKYNL
jgi:hemerythrin-like domain-containing protein